MVNNSFYTIFEQTTGLRGVDTLTTFDHIFSSPPLRVLDSHEKYSHLDNIKYLIWDINIPVDKRFKSEISIDGVFLNTNSPEYALFDTDKIYAKSRLHTPDFDRLLSEYKTAVDILFGKRVKTKETLGRRLEEIVSIYKATLKTEFNTPSEFYIQLLCKFYEYLSFDQHIDVVKRNSISLFHSDITRKFIPALIRETIDKPYGILHCIESQNGVFELPYFRNAENQENTEIDYNKITKSNLLLICDQMEKGIVIPAQEVVTWSFVLAGIKHIGNDYGVYEKLTSLFPEDLGYSHNNQLSKPKEDGTNFLKFNSKVMQYKRAGDKLLKVEGNPDRSMNLISALIHMGRDEFIKSYQDFKQNGVTVPLIFGEPDIY